MPQDLLQDLSVTAHLRAAKLIRFPNAGSIPEASNHSSFRYPGKNPVVLRSPMEYAGHNDIVEYRKYGLGIRMRLCTEGETLGYDCQGYRWDLGPLTLCIPDSLFLGKAMIPETPVSEQAFRIAFEINHPLWAGHSRTRDKSRLARKAFARPAGMLLTRLTLNVPS